jgi:5-methylcytosine-specific restriction endonuclease McrA
MNARRRHQLFMLRTCNIFHSHRRRALEAGATLDYTLPDLREMIEHEMQTSCIYCDQEITVQNFSIDHSLPTSRDGAHRFVNIHVCCMRCNQVKGALTAGEFTQLRLLLDGFEPAARRDILARLRAGGRSIHTRAGHA